MKIPTKAPAWMPILKDNLDTVFSPERIEDINKFVAEVDRREDYVYWDKLQYLSLPENISTELIWAYLKFTRQSKIMKTKLISKDGKGFGYWITENILKSLSFIDKYTSGDILVGDPTIHKSEQKRYLVNSLMEEAIASSQLEGAATTRKIAKEMLRSGRKPRNHAEQMIFNNFKTIVKIQDFIKQPLNEKMVLELHKSMTVDAIENPDWSGRFRTKKDEPIQVVDHEGMVLYEPPPPEMISSTMKILYDYANETEDRSFTHPAIKAINLHFYLSYIHPFNDGNGRTARALFYWYMLSQGYWMFECLPISRIFIKAPAQYARAFLYTEIDDLDLTYFVSYNLKVIRTAIDKLREYIKRKQKEVRQIAHSLRKFPELNGRQKELVKDAIDNPDKEYTISVHRITYNVTYETARRDLLYLERKKLFSRLKRGRQFVFVPSKNLHQRIRQG